MGTQFFEERTVPRSEYLTSALLNPLFQCAIKTGGLAHRTGIRTRSPIQHQATRGVQPLSPGAAGVEATDFGGASLDINYTDIGGSYPRWAY
ncbi:hypothetical protein NL676_010335 [Syzygium grande]|nr:hypothetical protein NL676_010335 [Syzygium grande]